MAIEEITKLVEESVTSEVFGVWFLIGAALVFFMQAGFAMVETGFTRAKNAGNIIMKNLMDFCIGTVVFVLLGFSLMMAEDYVLGIFGVPNLEILTDFGAFLKGGNAPSFVFNLVFCATAATIVSGSMAERTKFVSYCIYSGVISLFVYPIEAGWVWNSQGWLAQLGFHDFAGSAAIHSVGGITALIGAIMVGPRLGKYVKDKAGKVKKVNAIPGHSITLGALGCFILWFGWYGFNGAAAWDGNSLASIFVTTTIAPAVATCTTMLYTWFKNGKPDVSMCLNGSLAGLVGVTAGCDAVDALGSAIIGIVSGILVVVVVEVLDLKLHIDDPVGAVGVHLRIHRQDIQKVMFEALGFSDEEIEERFGFMVNAFRYGTPPHGGFAFGLDRFVMLMVGADSIRDVIAFPKVKDASCPMTEAPQPVDAEQLHVLGLDNPIGVGVGNKLKKNAKKHATDVEVVANLARLEFSAEEMSGLQEEMERIIAFADKLSTAPTIGVDATAHIIPMKNVFRDDVVEDEFTAEELLAAATTKHGGYIVVPRVVED